MKMKDDKLQKVATEARDLCSRVKQHFRIDKMSGYLDRLLKVAESIENMKRRRFLEGSKLRVKKLWTRYKISPPK